MSKCEIIGCKKEARTEVEEKSTGIKRKVCSDHLKDINILIFKKGKK